MSAVYNDVVPAAGTTLVPFVTSTKKIEYLTIQANLTYTSGGTSIKVFLQTSFDGGTTWRDVACLAFLVASLNKLAAVNNEVAATVQAAISDKALADDTIVNGVMGGKWRLALVVVGTYVATLRVDVEPQYV